MSSSTQSPTPPAEDVPSPAANSDTNSSSPDPPPASYSCQWEGCDRSLSDPEILYTHLCNDHIGRKSTNNLCLTCKWNGCGTTCAKRDHITSHLRVHTPLKPHACEICKKTFKRPQDLKKHEKIHTEEHHAQHKHSKAVTVPDPAFNDRVRKEAAASTRVKSSPGHFSDKEVIGLLPTPSPEMIHSSTFVPQPHPRATAADPYTHHPTWETIRADGSSVPSTGAGMKRSHDYGVEEFFTDVKKRRLIPSYDSHMAARLSDLAFQTQGNAAGEMGQQDFNPRSISLNIRTPEELAALNQFLLTLGRDTEPRYPQSETGAYNSIFDISQLSQLGIGGMPGIGNYDTSHAFHPGATPSASNYPYGAHPARPQQPHPHHAQSAPPSHSQWAAGLYSGLHDQLAGSAYDSRRMAAGGMNISLPMSGYPTPGHSGHMQPTPPLDRGSPASASSSPLTMTPPHRMDGFDGSYEPHVHRRQNIPAAVLAAPDYAAKTMRNVIPLRTLPPRAPPSPTSSSPESTPSPVEPPTPPRTPLLPPPRERKEGSLSSLYPLLTLGDKELTLPPLRSLATERANALPSLRSSLAPSTPADERLEKRLGQMSLDNDAGREGHAMLIRDLLVMVNQRYAREAQEQQRELSHAQPPTATQQVAVA